MRFCTGLTLALLLCSGLYAQGSLSFTTQTAAGNGNAGIMFNVTATSAITLYRVGSMPFSGTAVATTEVWYRNGGFGAPTTGAGSGWTLAGSTSVTYAAQPTVTQIPINLNLTMATSQVYGIAIIWTSGTQGYSTNTTSTPNYVGTHMTVGSQSYGGGYSAGGTPSMTPVNFPRGFCGTIYYDLANSAILNVNNLTGANAQVHADDLGAGGNGTQGASFTIANSSTTFAGVLTSVSVAASGTGADNTAYTQVALYRENNSTTSYDAGDTLVATAAAFPTDNGTIVFNIPAGAEQAFATSQSKSYYIVAKFNGSPLASPGHVFSYLVSALGVGASTVTGSLPSTPVVGFTIKTPSFAIADNPLTQGTAFPSTGGFVLQDFTVTYAEGPNNTLASVSLQATGSGNDASDYTSVAIYFDTNSSGAFDGADTLAGTIANFGANDGTVAITLTGSNTFTPATSRRYFVVVAFGASPVGGNTFQSRVTTTAAGYTGTTTTGVPAPAAYTPGLVISTLFFIFTDASPATQGTAFVGGTDFLLQSFTVAYPSGPNNTLTGITLTATGTGNDLNDYATVALYRDSNTSGSYETGVDTLVNTQGAFNIDNGTLTFTLSGTESQFTAGMTNRYFVIAAFNLNGTNNTTFQSQVTAASGMGLGAGSQGIPAPATAAPGLNLLGNNLLVTLNGPLAASTISASDQGPGGGGLMLGDFTVATINAAWTVNSFTFTASGSGDDSTAFNYLALHEDTNANGTFDGVAIDSLAVPVAGTAFAGNNGPYTATLTTQAFASQTSRRFFVVVKMASSAVAGDTFNVSMTGVSASPPSGGVLTGVPSSVSTSFIVGAAALTVALGPQSPNSLLQEAGTPFGYTLTQFRLTATNANIGVTGLNLTSAGSGNFATHLDPTNGVELYADNGNGVFDAGLDTLVYSAAGVNGLNVCNFTSTVTVNNGTNKDIWVRVNVLASAGGSTPETFRTVIVATNDVSVVGGVTVLFGTPVPDGNTLGVVVFVVASFSPTSGPQAGGTALTITGSGFTTPFTCTLGGVLCTGTPVVGAGGTQVTGLFSGAGTGQNLPIVITSGSLPPKTLTQTWSYFGGSSVGGSGSKKGGGGGGCTTDDATNLLWFTLALPALLAALKLRRRKA